MQSSATQPGGTNAYVPTDDDKDYVQYTAAVFDEHSGKEEDLDIDFTPEVLQRIVDACNRRIKDTGDCPPIIDRHTPDDQSNPNEPEPNILGYAKDFTLGDIGRERPRKAIFATFCIKRSCLEKAKSLPRRSIELWPDMVADPIVLKPGRSPIDSVALLGATRPARDLGKMLLKNKRRIYRYAYEERGPMDIEEIIKRVIEAIQALPEMEFCRETMNKEVASTDDELNKMEAESEEKKDPVDEKDGETPDGEPEEKEPDGGDELDKPKLKMAHDQMKRKYARLEADYAALSAKVEAIESNARHAERKSELIQLEAEGIAFDMVEEFDHIKDLEPAKFRKHLETMRKRYQKAPIGVKVKPMALPADGNLPTPTALSPADVYNSIGTKVNAVRQNIIKEGTI